MSDSIIEIFKNGDLDLKLNSTPVAQNTIPTISIHENETWTYTISNNGYLHFKVGFL